MLLQLTDVTKYYRLGETTIRALDGVSVEFQYGEFVAVMGPSGSGKSTFLQIASMLGTPTDGSIHLKERNVTEYTEAERARLRNKEIGFVFQQFNLLPRTSAIENVELPLSYAGVSREEARQRATEILERVGLGDRLYNTPAQLSGGQQQRVAIARALVNDPSIIFADEPTGNLDSTSGREIKTLLSELNRDGATIIMVTHDTSVASIAKRQIHFKDGIIVSDKKHTPKRKTAKRRKKKTHN